MSSQEIPYLYEYQIKAAAGIAYRPQNLIVHTLPFDADLSTSFALNYNDDNDADIGFVAINDLLTGSGKTLVSLLAAIEIAVRRKTAIVSKAPLLLRAQIEEYFMDVSGNIATPVYSDAIIVFCPRHLLGQWEETAKKAVKLYGIDAHVLKNPQASKVAQYKQLDKLVICIYDSVSKVCQQELQLVPAIIVDEFVLRGTDHNFATKVRLYIQNPVFGRLILVSADAGNFLQAIKGLRTDCLLKRWFNQDRYRYDYNAMLHALSSSSIMSTSDRSSIRNAMALDCPLELMVVRYIPTVSGLVFGTAFEISQKNAIDEFMNMGCNIRNCKTVGQIVERIQERLSKPLPLAMVNGRVAPHQPLLLAADRKHRDVLIGCLHKLSRYTGQLSVETCPICLDNIGENAVLLDPCFHAFCSHCSQIILEKLQNKCALCRCTAFGNIVVNDSSSSSDDEMEIDEQEQAPLFKDTISESIESLITSNTSLLQCLLITLKSIQYYVENETDVTIPFRVIISVPFGIDFNELKEKLSYTHVDIGHFKTKGSITRHISCARIDQQLAAFKSNEGNKLKILFTTEGKHDSFTGLDLGSCDCLVSVGIGNDLQRIGRLARLGRAFSRNKLYHIKILPQ